MIPGLEAWAAWHPRVVAHRLAGVDVLWCVAAGWAPDLFRGRQTREHDDLEIAAPADRFADIAARFDDCDFYVAGAGTVVPISAQAMAAYHQTWALDTAARRWRFDIFREPHEGDTWICRRDRRIRRPYREIIERDSGGIPYLAPEVVLLFKAKADRDKDRADLRGVSPLLDADRLGWLHHALALVHPGHPWLRTLNDPNRPSL